MADVRELAERLWTGQVDIVAEHHPLQLRLTEGQEIADGLLFYKGLASANTIDTGSGLVMLDTGAINDARLHLRRAVEAGDLVDVAEHPEPRLAGER